VFEKKKLIVQNSGSINSITLHIVLSMVQIQAFVSEYAVWRSDAGRGSLLASLAEAAFLTGLEKNR
jgi:hypothetical protein